MKAWTPLFLAALVCVCALGGWAVGADPQVKDDALPAKAQRSFDAGMLAAGIEEWGVSADYLARAHGAAPESWRVLFAYGLVCDRAGGRDLLALACYQACAADGGDPDAAKLARERVAGLKVRVRRGVDELLATAVDTGRAIGPDDVRDRMLRTVAETQLLCGDRDAVKATLAMMSPQGQFLAPQDRLGSMAVAVTPLPALAPLGVEITASAPNPPIQIKFVCVNAGDRLERGQAMAAVGEDGRRIVAPFDAVVVEVKAKGQMLVMPGAPLLRLSPPLTGAGESLAAEWRRACRASWTRQLRRFSEKPVLADLAAHVEALKGESLSAAVVAPRLAETARELAQGMMEAQELESYWTACAKHAP